MTHHDRETFLKLAINKAELSGWSTKLLQNCCLELNFNEHYYLNWFEQGLSDVLVFLEDSYDQEMLQILANTEKITGTTRQIAFALKSRIYGTSRSKILAIKNSYYYLVPSNTCQGISSAWRTVDLIWQYAGDTSLDFNYYSKRSLLHGVYLAAQSYYNIDNSLNYDKTNNFIDSCLNQIVMSAKCLKKAPSLLKKIPFLRILF
jgi:ubiquinone biosynthesis protein COQ9